MSDIIQVNDKRFRIYMTEAEIKENVVRVASEMSASLKDKEVVLCPVLTGSFMFFSDLTKELSFDAEVAPVRYSSYEGTQSTGKVKKILGFPDKCKGKHVVIVEDIIDSGITMDYLIEELQALNPASISICTFFFKPSNFQRNFKIDYIGKNIPNDFIVGYGLDYDGMGRTYRDIYSICE